MIKVLFVDDHEMVRIGVSAYFPHSLILKWSVKQIMEKQRSN